MMREAKGERRTKETEISLSLRLDGTGKSDISINCGFLKHMLTLLCFHARFDLNLNAVGDTEVDDHHLTEDIGITLGQAFKEALCDKSGIARYGESLTPMDEALCQCAADLCGRGTLRMNVPFPSEKIGSFDTELVKEFFTAFARESEMALHIRLLDGENSHHIAESVFKGVGRALRMACASGGAEGVPSTKGTL